MNKSLVKHLDLSENSTLSEHFYKKLGGIMQDEMAVLERLEFEDNRIGDQTLVNLIDDCIEGGRVSFFNVSKNQITDIGAKAIARLIRNSDNLRLLFLHYNKILGVGGIDIANAIGFSKSIQVLDISYNSITGTGIKIIKDEPPEGEKLSPKKSPKKGLKTDKNQSTVGKGFAELFHQGFAEPWARALRKNKSLIHVDMSHNNIRLDDVEIIADGLKDNHHILGLHFVGNDGNVDPKGFV